MLGLAKDLQQEACGDGGADNAGHIGAHGVHQQEVTGVVLLTDHVGNTGSHGNGGDTGRTDQRIDLAAVIPHMPLYPSERAAYPTPYRQTLCSRFLAAFISYLIFNTKCHPMPLIEALNDTHYPYDRINQSLFMA